jgi:hypothetical protein
MISQFPAYEQAADGVQRSANPAVLITQAECVSAVILSVDVAPRYITPERTRYELTVAGVSMFVDPFMGPRPPFTGLRALDGLPATLLHVRLDIAHYPDSQLDRALYASSLTDVAVEGFFCSLP